MSAFCAAVLAGGFGGGGAGFAAFCSAVCRSRTRLHHTQVQSFGWVDVMSAMAVDVDMAGVVDVGDAVDAW